MGRIGYARISTADQNLDMQVDALKAAGCDVIIEEKASGVRERRPKFDSMMEELREGDTLVIWRLDRAFLSTKHLISVLDGLHSRGVQFVSLLDGIDTTTEAGGMVFTLAAAVSEFEHDLIVERSRAGLKAARARGRKGGRPRVSREKVDEALEMYDKGHSIAQIMLATGLSNGTIYKYINLRRDGK